MARAEEAADGDPRLLDHRFHFQFANTLELAGRSEDALKRAQRALEFQPEFSPALNFVGYSWADRNVRLPEAFAMIRRAVEAEPENPAYQDSLGWVLYRMGRFAEALPPLEKAAKAMGEEPDATVLEHLGDVLEALNRHDEAAAAWRKAAAIESSPSLRKKLGPNTP
jgi:tetratricopeptide (TPR) repeat protein